MSSQIVKQGWIQKFSKGFMGEKWKRVYCRLYKDSSFFWFKNPDDPTSKGNVMLKTICNFLTVGSYVRAIPYSPELPSGARIDHVIAIPQEPRKKTKIHWFLCESDDDLNEWMAAICSTLPEPPKEPESEKAAPPPASPSMLKGQSHPGVMPGMPSIPQGHIPPYPSAGSHPAQLGFESFTSRYMHGSMGNVPPPPGYRQGGFAQGAYGQGAGGQFGNFRGAQAQGKDAGNKGVGKMAAASGGKGINKDTGGMPDGLMGGVTGQAKPETSMSEKLWGWGVGGGWGSWGSHSWGSNNSFGSFGEVSAPSAGSIGSD